MELTDAIKTRRSIRKFKQKAVEDSALKELVNAARMAPSAANKQQLEYYIVRDPGKVNEIFKTTAWASFVKPKRTPEAGKNAPVVFIVVSAPENPSKHVYGDAGAAIQNMLLRAVDENLGCCWLGSFDTAKTADILNLPEDREFLYLVAVGYPDEEPVAENIAKNELPEYYLDDGDVLHVPKYTVESITYWC